MWTASQTELWSGRDDSRESDKAKRVFQTLDVANTWQPELSRNKIALLGFASDAGVARNMGRTGAASGPPALRKALANMASHASAYSLVDLGDIAYAGDDLEAGQAEFAQAVVDIHAARGKTLVLGGGHETAFAHGSGLFQAYPQQHIAIINFDPHLDLRRHPTPTSGTPFAQLAALAAAQHRVFDYTCIGVSRAANTAQLLEDAEEFDVNIVWDTEVNWGNVQYVNTTIARAMARADVVYLTVDLDVLPGHQMPAVSAPAAMGIPLDLLMHVTGPILRSEKLVGADVAEFSPPLDINGQGARAAARMLWHMWQSWY